jgi:hypothetical protein
VRGVVSEFTSPDGVVQAPGGPDEGIEGLAEAAVGGPSRGDRLVLPVGGDQ